MYLPPFVKKSNTVLNREGDPNRVNEGLSPEITPLQFPLKDGGGVYYRYFAQNLTEGAIVEIALKEYERITVSEGTLLNRSYLLYEILWDSTRPVEDYLENGYVRHGANTRNIAAVKHLPQLFDYLANTGQIFVENLQALPNQYKTKDGRIYQGVYHIHREQGPLTNGRHTSQTHRKLYSLDHRILTYTPDTFRSQPKLYRNQNTEQEIQF